jgi:hypothetical protein
MERAWSGADGRKEEPYPWSTFVAVCETCGKLLLYENMGDQLEESQFAQGDLTYPKDGFIDAVVPEKISKIYEEAYRIKEIAPNAYVVMIRKALEAIAEHENVKGRNLQEKIEKLSEGGVIPSALSEATTLIREIGNIAAHADKEEIHPLLVYTVDDFFRTIIEYVYVAPKKLSEFKGRLKRYKRGGRS